VAPDKEQGASSSKHAVLNLLVCSSSHKSSCSNEKCGLVMIKLTTLVAEGLGRSKSRGALLWQHLLHEFTAFDSPVAGQLSGWFAPAMQKIVKQVGRK
jgi:hypothetical protein